MNYDLLNILEVETNFCDCLIRLFIFLGHIVNIIRIVIPIIIILLGSIDFIKALVAQKDDEMKKAQKIFIKRLIYGVIVFFVISLVSFLIGLAGGDTNNRCFKCVADVNGKDCNKDKIPTCKKEVDEKPKNDKNNDDKNDKDKVVDEPKKDCTCNKPVRVHFSGTLISDVDDEIDDKGGDFYKIYADEDGLYNDHSAVKYYNRKTCPKTIYEGEYRTLTEIQGPVDCSVDSFAIDPGTRLILYEKENFQGKVLFDRTGPLIVYNLYWKTNPIAGDFNLITNLMNKEFTGEAAIFTPDKREWSPFILNSADGFPPSEHYFKSYKVICDCE